MATFGTTCDACWPQACADLLARNEAIAVLLQLVACEKPAVLRFACVTLTNLTSLSSVQQPLVEDRAVAVLTACSDTKNFGQIKQCAQAFYNLTCKYAEQRRQALA